MNFWRKFLGLTTNDHLDKSSDEEYEEEEYEEEYEPNYEEQEVGEENVPEKEFESNSEETAVENVSDDNTPLTKEDIFMLQNEIHTGIYLLYLLFLLEGSWFVYTLVH